MMRVRAKIGFIAFKQNKTVSELILGQIKKSYCELVESKELKVDLIERMLFEQKAYENVIDMPYGKILK
jgi:hypothetical protein